MKRTCMFCLYSKVPVLHYLYITTSTTILHSQLHTINDSHLRTQLNPSPPPHTHNYTPTHNYASHTNSSSLIWNRGTTIFSRHGHTWVVSRADCTVAYTQVLYNVFPSLTNNYTPFLVTCRKCIGSSWFIYSFIYYCPFSLSLPNTLSPSSSLSSFPPSLSHFLPISNSSLSSSTSHLQSFSFPSFPPQFLFPFPSFFSPASAYWAPVRYTRRNTGNIRHNKSG